MKILRRKQRHVEKNFDFEVSHENKKIKINFKSHPRSKKIKLKWHPADQFSGTMPHYISKKEISNFLNQNKNWIFKQVKKNESIPKLEIKNGVKLKYLGNEIELFIKPCVRKKAYYLFKESKLIIKLPAEISKTDGEKEVKKQIENFYKSEAKKIIFNRLHFYNKNQRFNYKRVSLRNQKTRWGSCSSKGNLNFNWKLVMTPLEALDYVVVHELCHLEQMNHSKAFWNLVEEILPDYQVQKNWLRKNSQLLVF